MANKNKVPVDAYTKKDFEAGLHVLETSGVVYEPRSKERDQGEDWQLTHAAATDDEKSALARLDQLYANAQRLANAENDDKDSREIAAELLPKIEEIKRDTEDTLQHIGDVPPKAAFFARAIIADAEKARELSMERPHPRFGKDIIEIFLRVKEFYRRLKEFVSSFLTQDRYGNDKQPPRAA